MFGDDIRENADKAVSLVVRSPKTSRRESLARRTTYDQIRIGNTRLFTDMRFGYVIPEVQPIVSDSRRPRIIRCNDMKPLLCEPEGKTTCATEKVNNTFHL